MFCVGQCADIEFRGGQAGVRALIELREYDWFPVEYTVAFPTRSAVYTQVMRQFKNMFITPLYQQHASHTLAPRAYVPQPHMRSSSHAGVPLCTHR